MNRLLAQKILQHESRIDEWLRAHEKKSPFYLSADVRDAGFKVCPIDANLYPAGFNNLHPEFHGVAAQSLRNALADNGVYPESKLLVVSEEHTRNLFYLENLHVLGHIFEMAGFAVEFASQFVLPDVEYENGLCRLVTAKNNTVVLLHPELAAERLEQFAAIILNHDSSSGTAEWIQAAHKPVLPPWQAGWHSRSKACHFVHYRNLVAELAHIAGLDPWFLSALDAPVRDVDINLPKDRERVAAAAEKLLAQIAEKYAEYGIREKPYVFLKSDHGTYGMAMLTFENAAGILDINRREKNRLFRGKSSVVVRNYLLQEGVPTVFYDNGHPAETVVMLAGGHFIGSFSRANTQKSTRESLNSTGMYFRPHAPAETTHEAARIAQLLARIAAVATQREIAELLAARHTGEALCP